MRQAKELDQWSELKKKRRDVAEEPFEIGEGTRLNLSMPCVVIGGRNGAGKSRLLRSLAQHHGDRGLSLDLHHLCEQALIVLRSRDDFADLADEVGMSGPSEKSLEDVQRIVGRDYESVEWYAVDVEPADPAVAERFRWRSDQILFPYFKVRYRGYEYTSKDMGLGEFAVHFLFWILEQHRDERKLVLLLDEPDAYLPPVGASSLLARLQRICRERDWRVVLSTHSEEIITQAVANDSFVLVRAGDAGQLLAVASINDRNIADSLLARPSIRRVLFCEDESAMHLLACLLRSHSGKLLESTTIIWGSGHGSLRGLQEHLPRTPRPAISFGYVFDGDQRGTVEPSTDRQWDVVFLPTTSDPDELYWSLRQRPAELAASLNISVNELQLQLERLEGQDVHDWVNQMGDRFGRQRALSTLAELWCEHHPQEVGEFVSSLPTSLAMF